MKAPLTTGAYQARSLIASAQRCVNLYPETNPQDSEFPTTHYPTSGLVKLGSAPTKGFRGLYTATNGKLYAAVGNAVYVVSKDWTFSQIGNVVEGGSAVSMLDNSLTLVIVDGTSNGYTVDLTDDTTYAQISDPAFYGSPRVSGVDDFLIFTQPGTRQFYVSGALAVTFDPLDIASKNGAPDKTVAAAVINRRLWIFGERTTEVWFNAGASDFAFARDPSVFIEFGCVSAGSIATADTSVYWLSPDGMIFRSNEMTALRISTHAMEEELRTYARIDDSRAYCYFENGHNFYVITFPTADRTWSYDLATQQWHERMWLDDEGHEHRHRGACFARFNGKNLVGDWETGDLYEMTPDATDDAGDLMLHIRSWPAISDEKKDIKLSRFVADMQVGEIPVNDPEPVARLRWSDDRGRSWSNAISRGIGARGKFETIVQFNRLGASKERVFELRWSASVKTALNGGYIAAREG